MWKYKTSIFGEINITTLKSMQLITVFAYLICSKMVNLNLIIKWHIMITVYNRNTTCLYCCLWYCFQIFLWHVNKNLEKDLFFNVQYQIFRGKEYQISNIQIEYVRMDIKLGLIIVGVGYCMIYFFDSFFKVYNSYIRKLNIIYIHFRAARIIRT